MVATSLSLGVVRAQILAIRDKSKHAKCFGIHSQSRWTGPAVNGEGDNQLAIYQCDSPLEMRLALQEAPCTAAGTVLITPWDDSQVSDDILVRLAMRRLITLNSWEIVRSLFRAKTLDPRLTKESFLADMLLEHAATQEIPAVSGGFLDADTAWGILLSSRLGLSGAHPDLIELLRCSAESDLAKKWQASTPEFRKTATDWIAASAGDAASTVLRALSGEYGGQLLALGLVMGVIYDEAAGHELDKAAGYLEAMIGTQHMSQEAARRWRDAASAAAAYLPKTILRQTLDAADSLMARVGAVGQAWRSPQLDSGFEQRLSRFATALVGHVDGRATSLGEEFQGLYAKVLEHRRAPEGGRRLERLRMAIRLARWLANRNGVTALPTTSLSLLASSYAADSGFVDWARQVLRGGEPNKELAAAYVRLVDRVTELRETENRQFAAALQESKGHGSTEAGLISVERVVDQILAKVAAEVPVLALVIDGMSWAVFRELVADIERGDWTEISLGSGQPRSIGLAALPSVTEVCRTSLFCGQLRRGQANDEIQGFTTHPGLLGVSQEAFPPRLFHKAALEGDDDTSLAGEIRQTLAEKKQRVVGIVINAVDDHLDKGEQTDPEWTQQHIRVIAPILAEAKGAGRAVILLSDHGHVLDRQTECRPASEGARWRKPGGPISDAEIEITSSRVLMPEGGRVVVPWSEQLRYTGKKNGYHGGATPQEMLIPIGILWPSLQPPAGFEATTPDTPSWWTEPTQATPVAVVSVTVAAPIPAAAATLFDQPKAPTVAPVTAEPWIEALLQSEVFSVQRKLAGRVRIEDATLQGLLTALVSRGGSMTAPALAGAIGVPEHRLPGLMAVMQRLLNVEGYAILDRQDAANTVVLNVPLLKKQFELGQ